MIVALTTIWFVIIAFFAVMCWFGVRYDRGIWSVLAFFTGAVLLASSAFAFIDMARVWSGYPAPHEVSLFTIAALVFSWLKSPEWVLLGRG